MTQQASTFSWSALGTSSLLPAVTFIWFWVTYDFTNPDGTPDNAVIRSIPGFAIFAIVSSVVALLGFYVLGQLQLRRLKPSLWLALIFVFVLAVPVPALVYYVGVVASPSDPMPDAVVTAAGLFIFSWISLFIGAATQFIRMRPNNSFKPKPLRGSA